MLWGKLRSFFFLSLFLKPVFGLSFQDQYVQKVLPHFATGRSGTFEGVDKLSIAYRVFPVAGSSKAIVLIAGFTENAEKYAEWIHDLNQNGFSVYIMDHRGMGRSDRLLANPQIAHVNHFDDYVEDHLTFFDQVVKRGPEKDRYIFAHSMGGLVTAKLLLREPHLVKAAILNAPLFELNTGYFGSFLAKGLATSLEWAGRGKKYAPGFSDYDPSKAVFASNRSCASAERFEAYRRVLDANPSLALGGPSAHWVRETFKETSRAQVKKLGRAATIPILLYQAGIDRLVLPGGQNIFCAAAPNCKIRPYPTAHHEIWRDVDAIRADALGRLVLFFNEG
jgi:lysophospholipase